MDQDENNNIRRPIRRNKKQNNMHMKLVVSAFLAITILTFMIIGLVIHLPNFETIDFYEYHEDIDKDKLSVIMHDERIISNISFVEKNNDIYFPIDFIKEFIDEYIYWDEVANKITITTLDRVIRMNTDDLTYYVNNNPTSLNLPVYNIDAIAYMPSSFLEEMYNLQISYDSEYNTAIIDKKENGLQHGVANGKEVDIRYLPNRKEPIQTTVENGTDIIVFDEIMDEESKRTGYTLVRYNGLLGYIKSDEITKTTYESPVIIPEPEIKEVPQVDGKINMVWDAIYDVVQNTNELSLTPHEGLDVLSPTWFSFDEDPLTGQIINIGDMAYVEWAHKQGYQVWPTLTDNFNSTVSNYILSNTDVREYVIKQILAFIAMYDLDGINIDFEMIRESDSEHYVQFFRELAPFVREQGAILSVDMYVPTWTKHFNRTEVGKVVDYICIMAYDETTLFDKKVGPNASIGFVETGIIETLEEVDPEKVILGLPFYTRIWSETNVGGEIKISKRDVGIDYTQRIMSENGVDLLWLDSSGSHYGQYTGRDDSGNSVDYTVWVEDLASLEEKLKLYEKYNLAGVSGWRRGLESEEVWSLIAKYVP